MAQGPPLLDKRRALLHSVHGLGLAVDPGLDGGDVFGRGLRLFGGRHVVVIVERRADQLVQEAVRGVAGLDHRAVLAADPQGVERVEPQAFLLAALTVAVGALGFKDWQHACVEVGELFRRGRLGRMLDDLDQGRQLLEVSGEPDVRGVAIERHKRGRRQVDSGDRIELQLRELRGALV
jgi:hypothetical protein